MEPVTHILTGACLARTGLNRRAAYATLAMSIGAEFPDIDTLWSLRGPVFSFQHHRGITHTFVGVPFEAALIVGLMYALDRWRRRKTAFAPSGDQARRRYSTAAPVRWGMLYALALIALLSHLLLDWTNNYGLRPFFPFNPRWYAASITFIFDPLMFTFLAGALVAPLIFRLVSSEIGAKRKPFAARGWSAAALLSVVLLWTFRAVQHNHAVALAQSQTLSYAASQQDSIPQNSTMPDAETPAPERPTVLLQAQRSLASPDPLSPFRWWTVTDFGPVYQLGQVDTRAGTLVEAQQTQTKLMPSPAWKAAAYSQLGRAYLDWSPMPFVTLSPVAPNDLDDTAPVSASVVVTFQDPRFMGDIAGMRGRTPLQGRVILDAHDHVVQQSIDGKIQAGTP